MSSLGASDSSWAAGLPSVCGTSNQIPAQAGTSSFSQSFIIASFSPNDLHCAAGGTRRASPALRELQVLNGGGYRNQVACWFRPGPYWQLPHPSRSLSPQRPVAAAAALNYSTLSRAPQP